MERHMELLGSGREYVTIVCGGTVFYPVTLHWFEVRCSLTQPGTKDSVDPRTLISPHTFVRGA